MKTPTVRLASREELLGFVPYALGFHPADSVVLLGLGGRRLELAARADADSPTREVVRAFARSLCRLRGVSQVMILGYGPEQIAGPVRTIADSLGARGFHVVEALRVTDARFHCVLCDGCTPREGVRFDGSATASAASAVVAGLVARPNRGEVDKLVRPVGGLAAVAMTQAVERAQRRLDAMGGGMPVAGLAAGGMPVAGLAAGGMPVAGLAAGGMPVAGRAAVDDAFAKARAGERLDDDEVAWLSLILHDVEVRDHAWAATGGEAWQAELWLDLTRRADPLLVTPLATLFAWCSWRRGDGAIARSALTRALRVDPGYRLACLLREALEEGRPPASAGQWPPPLE